MITGGTYSWGGGGGGGGLLISGNLQLYCAEGKVRTLVPIKCNLRSDPILAVLIHSL